MRVNGNFLIGLLILLSLLAYSSLFTVKQTEYALKLRLGKVVRADYTPGLHIKWPIVEMVRKFDKRILALDGEPEHFLTSEKKNLIVDSYVKWRIVDVIKYFKTLGNERSANLRLAENIADGLRSKFGSSTIQQVVSEHRAQIMQKITEEVNQRIESLGIEVVDVRTKRIDLPKEVSNSVYRRMDAERERVARELRSRGEAEALRIRANADRQQTELLAQAERDAETIRGEGEARATEIYAQAFNQDTDFYHFYRSLNAYRNTFYQKSDILVLQPEMEFFKYFKQFTSAANSQPPAAP